LTFPREAAEAITLTKYIDCEQVYQHNPAYIATTAVSVKTPSTFLNSSSIALTTGSRL
jgi:hypothetical protein